MNIRAKYFDNAATTPLDPRVREAMLPYLDNVWGNAHSIHAGGLQAHEAVERAMAQVAAAIGADDPSQIYFTSGATEANNWLLRAADDVFISPFEHSSMREPALARGAHIISSSQEEMPGHPLISILAVNNEIGTLHHFDASSMGLKHSDITQAVGKVPVELEELDFASFSAHKFYGPKGIGALYCKDQPPPPLILGGDQEQGYRAGTLNVAAIVGMGGAAEIAAAEQPHDYEQAERLRAIILDSLQGLSDWQVNPQTTNHKPRATSPFILSLSFRGLEGEPIVLEMDRAGYAISAGAACSSRSTEPSHVLRALNLEEEWLRGTVRVSFGRFNTEEETAIFAKKLRSTVEMFRTL